MSYLKSIAVYKYIEVFKTRDVLLSVDDSDFIESGHLSELDLDSVCEIIEELVRLIDSKEKDDYYEWGVDLFSVTSLPNISYCKDDIMGIVLQFLY